MAVGVHQTAGYLDHCPQGARFLDLELCLLSDGGVGIRVGIDGQGPADFTGRSESFSVADYVGQIACLVDEETEGTGIDGDAVGRVLD